MFSEGIDSNEIAEKLQIERNTAYIYRKRVRKLLLNEINRLEEELN